MATHVTLSQVKSAIVAITLKATYHVKLVVQVKIQLKSAGDINASNVKTYIWVILEMDTSATKLSI